MFQSRYIAAVFLTLLGFANGAVAFAATLAVAVQTADGRPLAGAVLLVHVLGGTVRAAAPVNAVMDQVDRAFVPDLLVIPAGSTVEFPNSDSVSHQIYSFSAAKKFQLPLYRGKRYPPIRFEQPGFVTLGCNIHDSMLAYVLITDAPYFGRTDSRGSWSVDLPPGTYRITVWHPRTRESGEVGREMTIGDDEHAALSVRLTKPLQPAPLESGRHSWDAY